MTDERMTAAAIVAERPDMQPTGECYLELAMLGAVVAAVPPYGRREVAGFLRALLEREPVASGPAYGAHRSILGALRYELETAAIAGALDDPEYAPTDLREPSIAKREHELIVSTRDWAAGERSRRGEAYSARIDELLDNSKVDHEAAQRRLDDAVGRAQAVLAAPAAPEADDASAWLA